MAVIKMGSGSVGLALQVAFAKKLAALLEADAPRAPTGALAAPFQGWYQRLKTDIVLGENWLASHASQNGDDGGG